MKQALILSLILLASLGAQEEKKPVETKPRVQKIFILKYADPIQVATVLGVFGQTMRPVPDLHALSVSSSPDLMPGIEEAINRLDVPAAAPQNFDLTVYYLIGGETENIPGGSVPKELDSVVTQLKNSFPFKTYRLLDTLTLQTRAGQQAETSSTPGTLTQGLPSAVTQFKIRTANLSADGSTVSLSGLKAGLKVPMPSGTPTNQQFTYLDIGLNADVDIKEGQKVVVGRLSVNKDQALFLVLTARVVK